MSSVLLASPVARTQTDTETDAEAQTKTEIERQTDRQTCRCRCARSSPHFPNLSATHTYRTDAHSTHARKHARKRARALSLSHSSPHTHRKNFLSNTYVAYEIFQITDRLSAGPRCCGRNSSHIPALALAPVGHHFC